MKILVIGGGGREHALVWKLMEGAGVEHVWCAPGNGGISHHAECIAVAAENVAELAELAGRLKPDLTVVGPEAPLVAGIADEFACRGYPLLGPTKQAARLEGSKIFAKEFLERHSIPTAPVYGTYDSAGEAYAALCAVDWPVVIKADGLCGGKGVFVAPTPDDATSFIEQLMEKDELGPGGHRVLMEEALAGQELSYIILTDGDSFLPMVPTRDHKRVFDGNQGPNTGGMGAYSSNDLLAPELDSKILDTIVRPTLAALRNDGIDYRGFLYFGLMLSSTGPKVLEFNCRLGDPEAQAVLVRADFDLAQACLAATQGRLSQIKPSWKKGASVCVVMASGGYPGKFEVGKTVNGLDKAAQVEGTVVFHSGTRREGAGYYTSSGRVLSVTSAADSLPKALRSAYRAAECISFDSVHYRRDIAAGSARSTGAAGG